MSPDAARARAWIELDRAALARNAASLRARLPAGCALMPAVKAEAYGHGALLVARELNALGVDAFCVATAEEGAALRRGGVRGTILVLGYTGPELFPLLREAELTQTVADASHAAALAAFGGLHVHAAIDTGMHRLGLAWDDGPGLARVFGLEGLQVDGAFTHLCDADNADLNFTRRQARRFSAALAGLRAAGFSCPATHLLNSSGILRCPELGGTYARPGIALYGLLSTEEETERRGGALEPVLSLYARVATVHTLEEGEGAGYGLAFTARRPTRLAVLTIGYADGLPRALSCGKGRVVIRGRRVPIVGRVCMDQCLVDVTGLPRVEPGDRAALIGEGLSACETAARAGTITNELLSRLGPRLARMWKE